MVKEASSVFELVTTVDLTEVEPEIEAGNDGTEIVDDGLVLLPNKRGSSPLTVRFRRIPASGSTGFSAAVRSRNPRCRPLIISLAVIDRSTDEVVALDRIEGERSFSGELTASFPPIAGDAEVRLMCRLADRAPDASSSGVLVRNPGLLGPAPTGKRQKSA